MHFATIFTLGAAVVSTSASLIARQASLPTCADSCVANANLGGCIQSDTYCLCTNPTFVSTTTTCIEGACSGSDLQAALTYSQGLCEAVGVTLTASSTPAASGTATGATTSGSATTKPTSSSSGSASAATSKAAAVAHGANAFAGLAAVGLVALAL